MVSLRPISPGCPLNPTISVNLVRFLGPIIWTWLNFESPGNDRQGWEYFSRDNIPDIISSGLQGRYGDAKTYSYEELFARREDFRKGAMKWSLTMGSKEKNLPDCKECMRFIRTFWHSSGKKYCWQYLFTSAFSLNKETEKVSY